MDIELLSVDRLRFADGAPVRAASSVVALGDGFLVVPDDSTHAAWFRGGAATPVRVFPPVDGHEHFDEESGTKHLKPDVEAAVDVTVGGDPGVLLLGSGSSSRRMRWALLRLAGDRPEPVVADLAPLYAAVGAALEVEPEDLNLEGACVVGGVLRWFHRGLPAAGLPSRSVDLDLAAVVAAVLGRGDPGAVAVSDARSYDLGAADGVGLAVTDVVALPDGTLLASAAAEDSPNPRDDGPVVRSALALLGDDDGAPLEVVALPEVEGRVAKVEGLMVLAAEEREAVLLAVADVDDPRDASLALRLRVRVPVREG